MTQNEEKLANEILIMASRLASPEALEHATAAYRNLMAAISAMQSNVVGAPLEARLESTDIGGGFDKIIARLDRIELALLGKSPQQQALPDHDDSSHTD
jgi:hypothetical protein